MPQNPLSKVEPWAEDRFKRGIAPITMMKYNLPEDEWIQKETIAKQFVYDNLNGTRSLYSTAYLTIGRKEN